MTLPVRALPLIQNWDCHACGDCCRSYLVRLTDQERDRIVQQGWSGDPALQGREALMQDRAGQACLNQTPEGACVLLDEHNRCRIHARFGHTAKPLPCRVYPFVLYPAGDHWRIGLRFACPSVVNNCGRPVSEQASDLEKLAPLVQADASPEFLAASPAWQPQQSVEWPDLIRLTRSLADLIEDDSIPIELRLRRMLALAEFCRKARFEAIAGGKLAEFLKVMTAVVRDETPVDPRQLGRPGRLSRIFFRQQCAIYARKDMGPYRGQAQRGRWSRMKAAWAFATGWGRIPPLNALIPEKGFSEVEAEAPPLRREQQAILTRYLLVKLESFQFFGPTNFQRGYWDGLVSLMLTYPTILWLARVFRTAQRPWPLAVEFAIRFVDDNFGFNKLLGAPKLVTANQLIRDRGDLERLIAWYSRSADVEV